MRPSPRSSQSQERRSEIGYPCLARRRGVRRVNLLGPSRRTAKAPREREEPSQGRHRVPSRHSDRERSNRPRRRIEEPTRRSTSQIHLIRIKCRAAREGAGPLSYRFNLPGRCRQYGASPPRSSRFVRGSGLSLHCQDMLGGGKKGGLPNHRETVRRRICRFATDGLQRH